ncbi:MAG: LacI family DNA-binding transcriptional regulator [Sphingomonadaceae bacterium]|nr:LacI family DNA-binding transcriptional regulator [Sphingomonadaceae bacterium]
MASKDGSEGGRRPRRQDGALTISDVAAHAGVSTMTVSRVLNGGFNVRGSTRERVETAITALNYAPNPAARSLASATRTRIGLLYSNPSAGYLSEFLLGCLDQVGRSDLGLVIAQCEPGDDSEIAAAERMIADGIDGLLLPPPLCDAAPLIDLLAENDLPAAAVATGRPAASVSAVSIGDRAAARDMTRHLLALGHRRIGFITGNLNQTVSAERLAGHGEALAEAGVGLPPELEVPGLFSYRSGLQAAETLLALPDPPTAIFASNDDMGAAAIAVAHRRNLDVPRDLTVCGFDDTPVAAMIWPGLTTIRQPIAAMSRAAVDLLVDEIRARRQGKVAHHVHTTMPYEFVRRASDAPPRRG